MNQILDLTVADAEVIAELIRPDTEISVIIPDSIDPDVLHRQLMVVCRAVGDMRRATAKLIPIVGRFLLLARDHPDVWQSRGHQSYEEFLNKDVLPAMGDTFSRSSLFGIRRIYEMWPSLALDTYEKLGMEKLKVMATLGKQSDPNAPDLMEKALGMTAQEFKQWAERERHLPGGSLDRGYVGFVTTREVETCWRDFWLMPEIQAYAGETQGEVLMALMNECRGEWLARQTQQGVKA